MLIATEVCLHSPSTVDTNTLLVLHGHLDERTFRDTIELVVHRQEGKRRCYDHRGTEGGMSSSEDDTLRMKESLT